MRWGEIVCLDWLFHSGLCSIPLQEEKSLEFAPLIARRVSQCVVPAAVGKRQQFGSDLYYISVDKNSRRFTIRVDRQWRFITRVVYLTVDINHNVLCNIIILATKPVSFDAAFSWSWLFLEISVLIWITRILWSYIWIEMIMECFRFYCSARWAPKQVLEFEAESS